MKLRAATPDDLALLRYWDRQPHVIESDPDDGWEWESGLRRNLGWRGQLLAEEDGGPAQPARKARTARLYGAGCSSIGR